MDVRPVDGLQELALSTPPISQKTRRSHLTPLTAFSTAFGPNTSKSNKQSDFNDCEPSRRIDGSQCRSVTSRRWSKRKMRYSGCL